MSETGKNAWLLSLTDEQVEQLRNDDIAVVETESHVFITVHSDHAEEAREAVVAGDAGLVAREVVKRN
ncbi:hypothetical protein EXE51_15780 [Halorubrum sp. CGM5_25_10-8B]|uniref:hypothetical protein n=1 Tax=Halorubrum sp. CGM5_25_10-8B TaxID=2518115 RepID=UPI0010F851AC|nr:hypothetical protein [Halorubrum sp. CGM5_25_10-8B]TKX35133.1 hypothetical protein EXE51_15780 [Halorubrum sp. CGM5_25_10-8B]